MTPRFTAIRLGAVLLVACAGLGAAGLERTAAPLVDDPVLTRDEASEPQPAGVGLPTAPAPGQWCVTHERYIESLPQDGGGAPRGGCAPLGVCDNPIDRDASIPTAATPIKTYRLSIHVFCNDNGSNCAATPADVETAVARLNADFAEWRIQFVYQANYINSTRYRTLNNSDVSRLRRTYADSPGSKLNIYVLATSGSVSWGTFPWDPNALGTQGGIIMDDTWFGAASPLPTILTHEVGHCLGLWHVFHGVDEVPACSECYEAAGRPPENGDITGDLCSDTQPTPKNTNNCFDPPTTDLCSNNAWLGTPYLNYMSYSHTCPDHFTPHQAGRMHCWTDDVLSGWLQLPMPPAAPGTPTLTKLAGGLVLVAWADNSADEDGFRIQREMKQGATWIDPTEFVEAANTTSMIDAPGSGTFRYRLRAYNAIGDSAWTAWKQIKN